MSNVKMGGEPLHAMKGPVRQYGSLREKIAAEKVIRLQRNESFAALWADANMHAVGVVKATAVAPMGVCTSDGKLIDIVEGGTCGFAYLTVRPANGAFARWLKAKGIGHRSYYGGWEVSIQSYGQSMARKEAHAAAMAEYLASKGIAGVSHYSRMD
jgi:hypothetical protein